MKVKNIDSRRDGAITILHIIGMVMILLCHICQEAGFYLLGEIFIIGVPLFLYVSGYLSGVRKIDNVKRWLGKKAVRILTPYYIFILILFLIYEITGSAEISMFQWIFCLLNLQGLNYTYWGFETYGAVAGCGHLWFLTTIMLCYLITPLLDKFRGVQLGKLKASLLISCSIMAVFGLVYCRFQFSYLLIYILGYFAGVHKDKFNENNFKKPHYLLITAGMFVCTILRFAFRNYWTVLSFMTVFMCIYPAWR